MWTSAVISCADRCCTGSCCAPRPQEHEPSRITAVCALPNGVTASASLDGRLCVFNQLNLLQFQCYFEFPYVAAANAPATIPTHPLP